MPDLASPPQAVRLRGLTAPARPQARPPSHPGAVAAALAAAALAPAWALAAGPAVWGVPHLVAGLRFLPKAAADEPAERAGLLRLFAALAAGVAALRLLADQGAAWAAPLAARPGLEAASMAATFLACAWLLRARPARAAAGAVLVVPVLAAAWRAPLALTGALMLLHNLFAYAYWALAARDPQERRRAYGAAAVFAFVSVLIASGLLDRALAWQAPSAALERAGLGADSLGPMLAPWSGDPAVWTRLTAAYAFGQLMHYFVWLEALPGRASSAGGWKMGGAPIFRAWAADLGAAGAAAAVAVLLLMLGAWAVLPLAEARGVYFALAAYHAYLEVAVLGFALTRRRA